MESFFKALKVEWADRLKSQTRCVRENRARSKFIYAVYKEDRKGVAGRVDSLKIIVPQMNISSISEAGYKTVGDLFLQN